MTKARVGPWAHGFTLSIHIYADILSLRSGTRSVFRANTGEAVGYYDWVLFLKKKQKKKKKTSARLHDVEWVPGLIERGLYDIEIETKWKDLIPGRRVWFVSGRSVSAFERTIAE